MLKMLMGLPGPVADYPFPRSDVASYTRLTPAAAQIDEQTWRDLLLDDYLDRLAGETSIFGTAATRMTSWRSAPSCAAATNWSPRWKPISHWRAICGARLSPAGPA
jgi:hypothetical protein